MRVFVAVLVTTACGRVAFDPRADAEGDAPIADVAPSPSCAGVPWSPGAVIPGTANGLDEQDPVLRADGLELLFMAVNDVTVWRRATTTDAFADAPAVYAALSSGATDFDPSLSEDGLEVTFASDRSGPVAIHHATRATPNDNFGAPALVPGLEAINARSGELTRDGLGIYIVLASGGLARASRPSRTAPFGALEMIPETLTATFPSIAGDELELYFHTEPAPFTVYRRTRTSVTSPWGPDEVIDFGVEMVDVDVSFDGTTLVYQHTMDGELYITTRSCPQ